MADAEDVQVDPVKGVTQKQALEDICESRSRFGLFVIIRTHVSTSDGNFGTFFTYFVRFLALMLLVTQLTLPPLLMIERIQLQPAFCPSNSTAWETRVTIGFLSFLYFARTGANRFIDMFKDMEVLAKRDEVGRRYGLTSGVSRLRKYNSLDRFMHVGYAGIVYSIMLWITSTEADVAAMVFNCLAFEFMIGIDNEFVSVYLEFAKWSQDHLWKFGSATIKVVDLRTYIEYEGMDENEWSKNFSDILGAITFVFGILTSIFPLFMVVYGPICA